MTQTPQFIRILLRAFQEEMRERGEPEDLRVRFSEHLETAIRHADTIEAINVGNALVDAICDKDQK